MDLILRGCRVIDPASGFDGIADVAVLDGRIVAVEPSISAEAREVIDVSGKVVTAGLIDTHAHVYQHVLGKFGLNADMVGVQSGVTTLLDQGGPSCMTIGGFSKVHCRAGENAGVDFYLLLFGWRDGGAFVPGAAWAGADECRAHRAGGAG